MNTIVIGARSFIGKHYLLALKKEGYDAIATDHKPSHGSNYLLDLCHPSLHKLSLGEIQWNFALIAAGQTNVSFCENYKAASYAVNVTGTLQLAQLFIQKSLTPIVFSSDYVFDGNRGDYEEDALLSPITEYGRHKAQLERKMQELCPHHLILRLSKVYGEQKGDGSFIDEMIQILLRGEKIRAACDQIFCPIHVEDVCRGILKLQEKNATGLFNLCGMEKYSRYEIALKVAKALNLPSNRVEKIALKDLGENFSRPKDTTMSCKKFMQVIALQMQSIDETIARLIKQWRN